MQSLSVVRQPVVLDSLWSAGRHRLSRTLLSLLVGSLLLWVSARIQIPFYPVPLTLQTLVVLGLGVVMGPALGMATVGGYLLAGALGLPVFAGTPEKGIGLAYMMGPTGGYLLGFVLAVGVTGSLARRGWDRQVATTVLAMVLGNLAIYLPGVLWLGTLIGWEKPVLALGLYPFLLGDVLKIVVAALAFPALWGRLLNPHR
jgi:biotin transport system substrate-specific component